MPRAAAFAGAASMGDEGGSEEMNPAEAQQRLGAMRDVCQQLAVKINELDMDQNEHRLVLEALKPLDPSRKCFRMVGSVIVERTVQEVMPAVEKNMNQAPPPRRRPPPAPLPAHARRRRARSSSQLSMG